MWESPVNIYETISDMVENEMEGKIIVEIKKQLGIDINKEELIKALQYDRNQYDKGYQDGFNANKWVAVSERLPKEDGEYLLFGKIDEDEENYIFIGEYDSCGEQFGIWQEQYDRSTFGCLGSEFYEYASVIAWMPLPAKPYEAESEDETI